MARLFTEGFELGDAGTYTISITGNARSGSYCGYVAAVNGVGYMPLATSWSIVYFRAGLRACRPEHVKETK